MTNLILGIGSGLFFIICLWIVAALVFLISLRISRKVGIIAVITVLIITIVLASVPRYSARTIAYDDKPYDRLFYWRVALAILLLASSVTGLYGYIKLELTDLSRPLRITSWVL